MASNAVVGEISQKDCNIGEPRALRRVLSERSHASKETLKSTRSFLFLARTQALQISWKTSCRLRSMGENDV
jgi:hypothetical protein